MLGTKRLGVWIKSTVTDGDGFPKFSPCGSLYSSMLGQDVSAKQLTAIPFGVDKQLPVLAMD
jgi:hypothetical protein